MLAPTLWSQQWTPGFEGSVFVRVRACVRVWRCVSLGHAMEVFSHDDNVTAQSLPQTSCCYCVRWCTLMTKTCVSGVFFLMLLDWFETWRAYFLNFLLAAALTYSFVWINITRRATHMLRIFRIKNGRWVKFSLILYCWTFYVCTVQCPVGDSVSLTRSKECFSHLVCLMSPSYTPCERGQGHLPRERQA